MSAMARAGKCIACGRDLVQTDERTYHPFAVLAAGESCPDLIPIDGMPGMTSYNVPPDRFKPTP